MTTLSIKKKILLLLVVFMLLVIARLIYGYIVYPNGYKKQTILSTNGNVASFELVRKNYASKKMAYQGVSKGGGSQHVASTAVDQKYEKIGSLANTTKEYEQSEKILYDLIKEQELMIQLEQRSGLPKARKLNIALGVIPDKFDLIIEKLKKIGTLEYIKIDKKDKTNEYKKLEAQRISLQKARESLISLKQSGGSVGEMIELTNRLLVIENEIQDLGVSLGEFDEENEFCTVKFVLKEVRKPIYNTISLGHRFHVAFAWAANVFISFWGLLLAGLIGIWLFMIVASKAIFLLKKHSEG